ncbi:MAG: enoyl-CoA hydratase/isomerase family protein [Halobacteriota archaeon]|uniref:enoyl-CoA hydratase/isomerase family protein n=1 Tax=Natronomonas sp. TaxID=2184060 RepID=UPI003974EE26
MVNATFSVADGIGRVLIEREEALNSIDLETKEAIIETLSDYEDDEDVRAVLFETAGDRAFTAGGDLKEVVDLEYELEPFTESWDRLFTRMVTLDTPTVAKVDGFTFGGGFDLILHTDIVVAAEEAQIGQPEVNLGIVNHFSPALLPGTVGLNKTLDLLLTGEPITGKRAAELGLVARAVPADDLDEEVESVLSVLKSHSPEILSRIKSVVYQGTEMSPSAALTHAERVAHETGDGPWMREGVEAQLEKRDPEWAYDGE